MRKYVMEALGTFFLVLSFGLSGDALAIGLLLASMVYAGVLISGAHFNPAVSFAFFIKRELSFNTFMTYLLSQLLGVFAASGVILMLSRTVFYVEPPTSTNLYEQATVELLFTFVLVLVYLSINTGKMVKSTSTYGLVIGLTYAAIITIGSDISGAVFNPVISMGASVIDYLASGGSSFRYVPLYTLAPLAGSALAAFIYSYLNDEVRPRL